MVVVGGSLAGMAAAARLAKAGRPVRLLERTDGLGGRWAAEPWAEDPTVPVGALPGVLTFPAPWRDLFKKSGRALEPELTRAGLAMVPGPPAVHRFPDGSELVLPAERAAQHEALRHVVGETAARRWRDLVDHLVGVWQQLRPLGMELELRSRAQLTPAVRAALDLDRTVADLADSFGDPRLGTLIRAVALRAGSDPDETPAFRATELALTRTFGRWVLVDADGRPAPTSRLLDLLTDRLRLRRVAVELGRTATAIVLERGRVVGVDAGEQRLAATRVVSTVRPAEHLALTRAGWSTSDRWRLRRARPALAPTLSHQRVERPDPVGVVHGVAEVVEHTPTGPRVSYHRALPDGSTLASVHDHTDTRPDPGYGLAWRGARSWWSMPPISTGVPGLWTAGPHSRGGNHLSQVLLSGALASYACHDADVRNREPRTDG